MIFRSPAAFAAPSNVSGRGAAAFLIAVGAAGTFLGHPGPWGQIPALVLLAPLCLFLLAGTAETARQAALRGWLCGLLGNSAALYWIAVPVTEVGGLPLPAAVPLVLLLGGYLGAYSALSCLAAFGLQRLCGSGAVRSGLAAVLSGLAFAGMDVLCGFLFTGFPWLVPAAAFVPLPAWIQAAFLVGAYALGGIYAAGACLCGATVFNRGAKAGALFAAGLVLLLAPPLYGHARLASAAFPPAEDGAPFVYLGLVQGNIDQNQKWEPAYQTRTIARYIELSDRLLSEARQKGQDVRAVFWPETAMPFYFDLEADKAKILRAYAARRGVNLGFGTVHARRKPEGTRLYNRFQVIGPNGLNVGHYDKQHLVPFGEYVPLNLNLAFISAMLQGVPFEPGAVSGPLRLSTTAPPPASSADAAREADEDAQAPGPRTEFSPGDLALGVLICYEAIFPAYAQERVKRGAGALLNISNDAWFGRTSSPMQHLHLAALRAVEQNRPLARVTNTGYTALIDRVGRIVPPVSDLYTEDAFSVRLRPEFELSPYHRLHGFVEGFLLFAAAFGLAAHPATKRLRRRTANATAF